MSMKTLLGMTSEEFQQNQHKLPANIVAELLDVTEKTITAWVENKAMPAHPRVQGKVTFDWLKVLPWYVASQANKQGSQRHSCPHCGR